MKVKERKFHVIENDNATENFESLYETSVTVSYTF